MPNLLQVFPQWMSGAIFTRLGTLFPDEFPWASERGRILDVTYFGNHSGEKETSPLVDKLLTGDTLSTEEITTLANILNSIYGVQWKKLYRVLSEEYNPIENYSMVEEETPNITRERTTSAKTDFTVKTENDNEVNVYGFNSPTSVPQNDMKTTTTVTTRGDANKNVTTDTDVETGNRRLTRSGNIGVTTSQQMLESEIALWEWSFFETVFKHTDAVLTAPMYKFKGGAH